MRLLSFSFAMMLCSLLSAARIGIPQLTSADWDAAGATECFYAVGGKRPVPVATKAEYWHDGEKLHVRFQCSDDSQDWRAFKRSPEADLTLDEAVQVVLGTPSEQPAKDANFGGYEGAYIKRDSIGDIYEFTCNRAGSVSRTYDETPLPSPGFTAKVTENDNGWTAEMTIPLAAAGLNAADTPVIGINFFRFYRGKRYGRVLPNWGTYVPLSFESAVLLPQGRAAERTREAAPPAAEAGKRTGEGVIFDYYPSERVVAARIPVAEKSAEYVIRTSDGKQSDAVSSDVKKVVFLRLPVEAATGAAFNAELLCNGKVIKSVKCLVPETAPWLNTKAGSEYIAGKVPYPWKAPQWNSGRLKLAFAEMDFANAALPAKITTAGGVIVPAPMTVSARLKDGRILKCADKAAADNADGKCMLTAECSSGVAVKTRVDYDGFTVIRLQLRGASACELKDLTVRIPLAPEFLEHVQTESVQRLVNLDGSGHIMNAGAMWVGNVLAGLGISFDRQVFFSPEDNRQIEIVQAGKDSHMLLRLVTEAGQVADAGQVFQFFVQPTPTRRDNVTVDRSHLSLWFENWSPYQGYPDLTKIPEIGKRAAAAHAEGRRMYIYFSQLLAENAPGYDVWSKDLIAPPERLWYRRAYNPGKGVACRVMCLRGAAGDLLLDNIDRIIEATDLDGVYLDGPTHPFSCMNPAHDCDDTIPAAWDASYEDGRILGQRAFVKRLRGLFAARGKKFPLWAHTGGGISLPTLGLCDYFYEGEQMTRYRPGYLLPPENFLINYTGAPFGFCGIFLPQLYFTAGRNCNRALPWSLVNGLSCSGESELQDEIFRTLAKHETTFHPYWRPGSPLERLDKGSAFSACWTAPDFVMVVVSNLRYHGTQQVKMNIGQLVANIADPVVKCLNAPDEFKLADGILECEVPVGELKIFEITPAKADAAAGAFAWERIDKKGQAVSMPCHVVSINRGPMAGIKAVSAPEGDFEIRGKLFHNGRLRLQLDALRLNYDHTWSVSGVKGVALKKDDLRYVRLNTPVDFAVSRKDGKVTVEYAGRKLVDAVAVGNDGQSQLSIATWAGNEFALAPAGTALPEIEAMKAAFFPYGDASGGWKAMGKAGKAVTMPFKGKSVLYGPEVGIVNEKPLPENFRLAGNIRHDGRLRIHIDGVKLIFDHTWKVSGLSGKDTARNAVSAFGKAVLDREVPLVITMNRGRLTVEYDGKEIIGNYLVAEPQQSHDLLIATWAGNTLEVTWKELTLPQRDQKKVHPAEL